MLGLIMLFDDTCVQIMYSVFLICQVKLSDKYGHTLGNTSHDNNTEMMILSAICCTDHTSYERLGVRKDKVVN